MSPSHTERADDTSIGDLTRKRVSQGCLLAVIAVALGGRRDPPPAASGLRLCWAIQIGMGADTAPAPVPNLPAATVPSQSATSLYSAVHSGYGSAIPVEAATGRSATVLWFYGHRHVHYKEMRHYP